MPEVTSTGRPGGVPEVSRGPGLVVIAISGDVDHAATTKLREVLFDPTICDQPAVAVDLRDVTHLSSTAIGGLVAARRWHQARNTNMSLIVDPAAATSDVLRKPPLSTIFDIRGTLRSEHHM